MDDVSEPSLITTPPNRTPNSDLPTPNFSSMSTETRNQRKTLIGNVTSRSGDKSIKVTIPFKVPHPRYKKIINRKTILHVHDEKNETHVGDKVEVMETRPISKLKRWRVVRVIELSAAVELEAKTERDVAAELKA
jgi:small subunit ribosomal protein S17